MSCFLQACRLFVAAVCLAAAGASSPVWAGEVVARTARQREIVKELSTFRPQWADAGGGAWMLSRWDTDAGLARIVALPSGAGNAAAYFRLLEEYYPAEPVTMDEGGEDSRGVEALLGAAEVRECRFSPEYYPEVTGADVKQPDFQVMRVYLQALLRRGERAASRGDGREAERCFRAALVCGMHLTTDKSSSVVFVTGLIFKVRGAQAFANYLVRAGDGARVALVKEYSETLAMLMRAFIWKANVALSEFAEFACLPASVMVAKEDGEAFWRKEAVIRLATLRYGIPDEKGELVRRNPEFERIADDALSWVAANDPDPTVRRMAIWGALNVTPQNYAAMHHEF